MQDGMSRTLVPRWIRRVGAATKVSLSTGSLHTRKYAGSEPWAVTGYGARGARG
jgi:hypothetical protein